MAALEVYHLDDAVATRVLKRRLRPFCFTFSLDKKPSSSYVELLFCAQKYICTDEADSTCRETEGWFSRRFSRTESSRPSCLKKLEPPRRPNNRCWSLAPTEDELTPLLAPRFHILLDIEGEPYFQCPPPMKKGAPMTRAFIAVSIGTTTMTLKAATVTAPVSRHASGACVGWAGHVNGAVKEGSCQG